MKKPAVQAEGIVKRLGRGAAEAFALRGVSLQLPRGELTLLMGPSGSGKTTLLLILGCMLSPDEGAVSINGRSVTGLPPEQLAGIRRDEIGFVFQSYHLFPTLTAAENVQLALDLRGEQGDAARRRAREALDMVDLAHKFDSFPGELSGGEQQRVAIARAIVARPSLILADEPTAALDAGNGRSIMEILVSLAHGGDDAGAVLVVTHDPRILPFADRIVEIEDGLLAGPPRTRRVAPVDRVSVWRS